MPVWQVPSCCHLCRKHLCGDHESEFKHNGSSFLRESARAMGMGTRMVRRWVSSCCHLHGRDCEPKFKHDGSKFLMRVCQGDGNQGGKAAGVFLLSSGGKHLHGGSCEPKFEIQWFKISYESPSERWE